jgi:hypothetical protein
MIGGRLKLRTEFLLSIITGQLCYPSAEISTSMCLFKKDIEISSIIASKDTTIDKLCNNDFGHGHKVLVKGGSCQNISMYGNIGTYITLCEEPSFKLCWRILMPQEGGLAML